MKELNYYFPVAHWSLTDFYPEVEAELRETIQSGEDFETNWWTGKHTEGECYARWRRKDGKLSVEVEAHTDELTDMDDAPLICDALETIKHCDGYQYPDNLPEELPDELYEHIMNHALLADIGDTAFRSDFDLDPNTSFEELCEVTTELASLAKEDLDMDFQRLVDIAQDELLWLAEETGKE